MHPARAALPLDQTVRPRVRVAGEREWRKRHSPSTFLEDTRPPSLPSGPKSLPEPRQEMPTPAIQDSSRDAFSPGPAAVRRRSSTSSDQERTIQRGPALGVLKEMDSESVGSDTMGLVAIDRGRSGIGIGLNGGFRRHAVRLRGRS